MCAMATASPRTRKGKSFPTLKRLGLWRSAPLATSWPATYGTVPSTYRPSSKSRTRTVGSSTRWALRTPSICRSATIQDEPLAIRSCAEPVLIRLYHGSMHRASVSPLPGGDDQFDARPLLDYPACQLDPVHPGHVDVGKQDRH